MYEDTDTDILIIFVIYIIERGYILYPVCAHLYLYYCDCKKQQQQRENWLSTKPQKFVKS